MIIECKHCGAPLDVVEGANLTRCNYCGRTQRVQSARTQLPQTPPNWNPPPNWIPPAHVPARSVQLSYDATKKVGSTILMVVLIGALLPVLIIGGIVAWVTFQVKEALPPPSTFDSPAPSPPKKGSGGPNCQAAVKCCEALGSAAMQNCANIAAMPDERMCAQLLTSLRQAAEALGKSCD
jgi:hypothetical protein